MKTVSKLTTLIAFVAFANVVLATGNLKVNILPLNSDRAVVAISNNTESTFQISIEDKYGAIVYYKETSEPLADYSKVYDFSLLEKGTYNLTVAVDGEKIKRDFTIEKSNISVGKAKADIDPFFSYKNDALKISFLNFAQKDVNISIFNNNEMIYSKKAGSAFNISEGFDVSKLYAGDYSVVLSADNNSYAYNFTVK